MNTQNVNQCQKKTRLDRFANLTWNDFEAWAGGEKLLAEWENYLKELREQHIRKRRLIEILDDLGEKPIVKKRR